MPYVNGKYRGTTDYILALGELVRAAQYEGLTTYQDITRLTSLPRKGRVMAREIGLLLGAISEDEAEAGRPMLSAVAVNARGGVGSGFFDLARQMGRLGPDADEEEFLEEQRQAVYETWRRRPSE